MSRVRGIQLADRLASPSQFSRCAESEARSFNRSCVCKGKRRFARGEEKVGGQHLLRIGSSSPRLTSLKDVTHLRAASASEFGQSRFGSECTATTRNWFGGPQRALMAVAATAASLSKAKHNESLSGSTNERPLACRVARRQTLATLYISDDRYCTFRTQGSADLDMVLTLYQTIESWTTGSPASQLHRHLMRGLV